MVSNWVNTTAMRAILLVAGTALLTWGIAQRQYLLAGIGAKYHKSAAQVALRWLTQRGIIAIPKSSHKERMQQNFDIFDFSLTADEMAQIATMNQHDTGTKNFGDPAFVKYLLENYG